MNGATTQHSIIIPLRHAMRGDDIIDLVMGAVAANRQRFIEQPVTGEHDMLVIGQDSSFANQQFAVMPAEAGYRSDQAANPPGCTFRPSTDGFRLGQYYRAICIVQRAWGGNNPWANLGEEEVIRNMDTLSEAIRRQISRL